MLRKFLLKKQAMFLKKMLNVYLVLIFITTYELKLFLTHANLLYVIYFLQNHVYCLYKVLVDIVVVDYPGVSHRFRIIYNLLSIVYNVRLRLVLEVGELQSIPSVTSLFLSANWAEREV
jgi:NADH:ubiquinone oxidoreductase subunit C